MKSKYNVTDLFCWLYGKNAYQQWSHYCWKQRLPNTISLPSSTCRLCLVDSCYSPLARTCWLLVKNNGFKKARWWALPMTHSMDIFYCLIKSTGELCFTWPRNGRHINRSFLKRAILEWKCPRFLDSKCAFSMIGKSPYYGSSVR